MEVEQIKHISIYAYPDGGSTPYVKVSGGIYSSSIDLPEGVYTLLILNDFVGDIVGVNFSSADVFALFSAEAVESDGADDTHYQIQSDELLAQEPDQLAAWHIEGVEVSAEMISCLCCDADSGVDIAMQLDVTPTPVTTLCTVELGVENLSNAATIEATIRGFASGVYLSTRSRFSITDITLLNSADLDSRTYSSDSDGVVRGVVNSFGKVDYSSQSYEVVIDVILNSGELVTFTRDVTAQVEAQDGVDIYIDLTSAEDTILLPESSSVGFGVENWGDNEQVEVL